MSKAILELIERNDSLVQIRVKNKDGTPFSLVGYSLEFYIKASSDSVDGSPIYTTTGGSIVITDASNGLASMQTSASDLTDTTLRWYKLDGIKSSKRITLGYGLLRVINV